MTNQEIVNFVAEKLREQGRPSTKGACCLYRGPDGTKCAVGWLIPDKLYRESLEEQNVGDEAVKEVLQTLGLDGSITLLGSLQSAHDLAGTNRFVEKFNKDLQRICTDFNLTYPE